MIRQPASVPLLMLLLMSGWSAGAKAAESHDSCRGFIDALPATISTQGVWCLRKDLATGVTSGSAITVTTNNVTLDCNGYKIGGLAAGAATLAYGVGATGRISLTVRRCNIRGFNYGVNFDGGGAGHLIEDNRFDSNTGVGVLLVGDGNTVRDNLIHDTGGMTHSGKVAGIWIVGDADISDNTIDGVTPSTEGTQSGSFGIHIAQSQTSVIQDNIIRSVDGGNSSDYGIYADDGVYAEIVDNHIQVGAGGGNGNFGIFCDAGMKEIVAGNRLVGHGIALVGCDDDGGNVVKP